MIDFDTCYSNSSMRDTYRAIFEDFQSAVDI